MIILMKLQYCLRMFVKALVKLYLILALTVKDLPSLAVSSSRDEWINELSRLDQCYEVSYYNIMFV